MQSVQKLVWYINSDLDAQTTIISNDKIKRGVLPDD